jgi:hypothetical protein
MAKIKIEKCAPSRQYTDGSCFDLESLKLIANNYNKINPKESIVVDDDKNKLVNNLTKALADKCSSQYCWLKLDLVTSMNNVEINDNTFRPSGPSKKYEWLSTNHINEVINQYEEKYPEFLFLGAVPNDFEELEFLGLSNINYDKFLETKKTKLGLVINLDTHDQSGSHWVAIYIDLLKNQLYYFDSVGKKPGIRIKKFNNKVLDYLYYNKYKKKIKISKILKTIKNKNKKEMNKDYKALNNTLKNIDIQYNEIQHQQKNSECGVYSINCILRLVSGEKFSDIKNNITTDEEVNKCRKIYFRE